MIWTPFKHFGGKYYTELLLYFHAGNAIFIFECPTLGWKFLASDLSELCLEKSILDSNRHTFPRDNLLDELG